MNNPVIYTIGHSTHDIGTFITMLKSFRVQLLVDVRHYPGSRRYPHFNSDRLAAALREQNIEYLHLVGLGGRRTPVPDSPNDAWRVTAFRGYADYMATPEFSQAFETLKKEASARITAFMCSEAVWWSCHRSLISDLLKVQGWTVMHIMKENKADEHPYTKPARVIDGKLSYSKKKLL